MLYRSGGAFSPCRTWRYGLHRAWLFGEGQLTACLLNPSIADERRTNPTTTFMVGIAQRRGHQGYEAVNLFALVGTDPDCLYRHPDPVGPDNDAAILEAVGRAQGAGRVLIAWGNHGAHLDRAARVLELLTGIPLLCFGKTASGAPRFPRALSRDIDVVPFR